MSDLRLILERARQDAAQFILEFPGKEVPLDWICEAWLNARIPYEHGHAYQDELITTVECSLMYVRYIGTKICYTMLATGNFFFEDIESADAAIIAHCDNGGGMMVATDACRMTAAWACRD